MESTWEFEIDEPGLGLLAACLALKLRPGDCLALKGDLGQGKTTFARAFIRAARADADAEVPSPTFAILQTYETPRGRIAHFDLYRLSDPDDLIELGFEETVAASVSLIEWPERAGDQLPSNWATLAFAPAASPDRRKVTLSAYHPPLLARVKRAVELYEFIAAIPAWREATPVYLQGDASTRSYARLIKQGSSAILMDAPKQPDGPPLKNGKSYSQIAHLAEDVGPFVAIGELLQSRGVAAPALIAADLDRGFLLLEDFGDLAFAAALAAGHDQTELYRAATDVLIALRKKPLDPDLPISGSTQSHRLPRFDRAALEIELSLILDWYWPEVKGAPAPDDVRRTFMQLWAPLLDRMLAEPPGLFLRDFHSPNLFWRPKQSGLARVGVIDYQDALAEPWAYDLVSLLQDARVTVPVNLERELFEHYCASVASFDPAFDRDAFAATYAVFGAQRNTRLVGLWVRLLRRDGKPNYLRHMPRTWDYLMRDLRHPALAAVAGWYAAHFPQDVRNRPIDP